MESRLLKDILIATDGKKSNENTIDCEIELVKITEANLYVIFVIDTAAYTSSPTDESWENLYHKLKKEGKRATEYVAERAQIEGIETREYIAEGHPADEIIKYAERNSVNLIIMGTAEKKWLDGLLLGSVAEKVL